MVGPPLFAPCGPRFLRPGSGGICRRRFEPGERGGKLGHGEHVVTAAQAGDFVAYHLDVVALDQVLDDTCFARR